MEAALKAVQSLDPAGVGARDLKECMLLQIESVNGKGGVAWQIVSNHMRLLETRQFRELAKVLGRPQEHIDIAVAMIRHLNPRPGVRYSGPGARSVEPDVYFIRDGEDFIIQMNEDELPQLRLNAQYRKMLDRDQGRHEGSSRLRPRALFIRHPADEKHRAAEAHHPAGLRGDPAAADTSFWRKGIDALKPMMIKDVAEEVGVHPSTVSRAVANKYAHTPHGVYRTALLFLGGRAGPVGQRNAAAAAETQSQEDDRRRGLEAPVDGRSHHGAPAGRRHRRNAPDGGEVS